jgi:magnesium chelatase family protein
VGRPEVDHLLAGEAAESTAVVAARVAEARARAAQRGGPVNAQLPPWRLEEVAPLDRPAQRLVERALRGGRLTGRGLDGIRRVARTVADLTGHDGPIDASHASAALALRAEPTFLDGRVA